MSLSVKVGACSKFARRTANGSSPSSPAISSIRLSNAKRISTVPWPRMAPTFTDNDMMVNSYGLPECLDWVEQQSGWSKRKGKLGKGKGLGMACSHYISGASKPVNWTGEPHATVKIL